MKTLTFVLSFLAPCWLLSQNSIEVTYFVGDIPTSFNTYDETCNGPLATLSVTLPSGDNYEITNVHVEYAMTALGNGFKEHQRSKIRCDNNATEESEVAGTGASQGIMNYSRDISIANGIYPGGTEVVFEMWARRTFEDVAGCNTNVNRVNAASWTITVYYGNEIGNPRVGINNANPEATLDVDGKIKVGDDTNTPSEGMIRWNAENNDFEGYLGSEWTSLTRNSRFGAWGNYLPISYQSSSTFLTNGGVNDRFGTSIDCDGQSLIIGSPGYNNGGSLSKGRAVIYVLNNSMWEAEDTIYPSSTNTNLQFANAVAIQGNYAFVGSAFLNPNLGTQTTVYIFKRIGLQWVEDDVLTQNSTTAFGSSVDISGDYAILRASGSAAGFSQAGEAFFYHFNGTDWLEEDNVTASTGHTVDGFGSSAAISGDYALVGSPGIGTGGSVFVFHRSGTTWTEEGIMTQPDGVSGDNFGMSLSLLGDSAMIGCPKREVFGNTDQGIVYLYERNLTDWEKTASIVASDGAAEDLFGSSLSFIQSSVLVGAPGVPAQGKAYVFQQQDTTWTIESILLPSDGAAGDDFGSALSLCLPHIIIGAPYHDINAIDDQGKLYFYIKDQQ